MLKTTTIAALAIALAAPAYAATISAYDTVNGPTIAAGQSGAGVTSADLTRGAGVQQSGNANHFRSSRWTLGGDLATAVTNNDYIEWGFSSTSAYTLDMLSLAYDRTSNGPQSVAILASFDGGAYTQIFADSSVDTAGEIADINLSAFTVSNATFRLFGWDSARNGAGFFIRQNGVGDNNNYGISLTGTLAVVPLPAGLPLLAGGLALLGLTRRKG